MVAAATVAPPAVRLGDPAAIEAAEERLSAQLERAPGWLAAILAFAHAQLSAARTIKEWRRVLRSLTMWPAIATVTLLGSVTAVLAGGTALAAKIMHVSMLDATRVGFYLAASASATITAGALIRRRRATADRGSTSGRRAGSPGPDRSTRRR